jgi:ketose-bisphosphate aldolase/C_GCAxxG_C_C family probable redox protein
MLVTLAEILQDAEQHGYAVIAPDFPNIQVANALLDCAEALNAPLALSFSPVLKPATGVGEYAHFIRIIRELAAHARVPVALHLDHAFEIADIREAVQLGFTSVMIDASAEPWDVNVARTQEVVNLAHNAGVSVESELGHVATGGKYLTKDSNRGWLTDPEQAAEFVRLTGIDALAVAIGTVHGEYRGEPRLDFERLENMKTSVPVPLVLHGSSGTGEQNLRRTIELGIRKINVFSDLMKALQTGISEALASDSASPISIQQAQDWAVKSILQSYLELSDSIGAGKRWETSLKARVKDLFLLGYTCAEAIYMAFAEKEKYYSDTTQLFGVMLGGGICNQGGHCGALLGGYAVLAARYANVLTQNKPGRRMARQAGVELMEFFAAQHHYLDCRDLIHLDFNVPHEAAAYKQGKTIDDICLPALYTVVDWLEQHAQRGL